MIPKNIKREHVIKAIKEIKKKGILKGRDSKKFLLKFNGRYYPPKYVISLANKYANGEILDPDKFNGGRETNNFLKKLGFNIVNRSTRKKIAKSSKVKKDKGFSSAHTGERCRACKETIKKLLERIYGKVEENYKFNVGVRPEDFKESPYYNKLKEIYKMLQNYRGFEKFVKAKTLPNCDFFIPNPGFILEFDESQHFTIPRKMALEVYPSNLELNFNREKWINLCKKINTKDNDPPYRDEQRAWYDTLRDFLPAMLGLKPTVRLFAKDFVWCSLNPDIPQDVEKFGRMIKGEIANPTSWLVTVIPQLYNDLSNEKIDLSNRERFCILRKVVDHVLDQTDGDGIILFPAGWFNADGKKAGKLYDTVEKIIRKLLNKVKDRQVFVVVGIDGRESKDQIAIAVDRKGIKAIGRKFHPTKNENNIEVAKDYLSCEDNKKRIFELNGKKYFMCVCYDIFGIKHKELKNPEVDVILNLIHGFKEKESEANFARHGLAGASSRWKCRVFAAATFFKAIPEKWPSAVYWDGDKTHSSSCKYSKISIYPLKKFCLDVDNARILLRFFEL